MAIFPLAMLFVPQLPLAAEEAMKTRIVFVQVDGDGRLHFAPTGGLSCYTPFSLCLARNRLPVFPGISHDQACAMRLMGSWWMSMQCCMTSTRCSLLSTAQQ